MAGVSQVSVSRVLNRPEMVTTATMERVRRVIDRTGYVPNLLAGGLASLGPALKHPEVRRRCDA